MTGMFGNLFARRRSPFDQAPGDTFDQSNGIVAGDQQGQELPPLAGGGLPQSAPQTAPPEQAEQDPETPAESPRKINWWGVAADALSGLAGGEPVYAPMVMKQREREQTNKDAMERWLLQQQFKQMHPDPPKPLELQRQIEYLRGLPENERAEAMRLLRSLRPPQTVAGPDGAYQVVEGGAEDDSEWVDDPSGAPPPQAGPQTPAPQAPPAYQDQQGTEQMHQAYLRQFPGPQGEMMFQEYLRNGGGRR